MVVLGIVIFGLAHCSHDYDQDPAPRTASLLGQHSACVESVAFHPGGRWLASAARDGSVYLWDVDRRELDIALEQAPGSEAIFAYCLAFTPDGSSLAAANSDGSVTLWNVASGTRRRTFRCSDEGIRCVAFSPDGRLLATGSFDNSIALWDVAKMQGRAVWLRPLRQPNCVVFSPDGRILACACADGTASLWDVSSGENIRTLIASENRDAPNLRLWHSRPMGKRLRRRACIRVSHFGTRRRGVDWRPRGCRGTVSWQWHFHPRGGRSRGARSPG